MGVHLPVPLQMFWPLQQVAIELTPHLLVGDHVNGEYVVACRSLWEIYHVTAEVTECLVGNDY